MLKELLEKPESYRRKVAFIVTGIIGVVIFAIWLIITQYNVKQAMAPTETNHKTATEQFRESLPSINKQESITTELMKQQKDTKLVP